MHQKEPAVLLRDIDQYIGGGAADVAYVFVTAKRAAAD